MKRGETPGTRLARRYELSPDTGERFERLLGLIADDPHAPTSISDPTEAADVHLADSLSALPFVRQLEAGRAVDVGSGAGLPGLVLAIVAPDWRLDLVESVGRKAKFIAKAASQLGLENVNVVNERAEAWAAAAGHERYRLFTARAVAPLAVLLEYAAPLLELGGTAICWKGRRGAEEESAARRAADQLGMEDPEAQSVSPYETSRDHHLWLSRKTHPTPERFPRRVGVAERRPL